MRKLASTQKQTFPLSPPATPQPVLLLFHYPGPPSSGTRGSPTEPRRNSWI
ncbi:hypothetical protein Hanom_Chr17g01555271 [Helianthus anomalus]